MRDVFPHSLDAFLTWLINFIAAATVNMGVLKLDQIQIDGLTALKDELIVLRDGVTTAKATLKKAVSDKDEKQDETHTVIRKTVKAIYALDVAPGILDALGLKVHDTEPSHEVPNQVSKVIAKGLSTGGNKVYWDSNGNPGHTQYIVEAKYDSDSEYHLVDVVTATKFFHEGQTPGVRVSYRIIARRGNLRSIPSESAVVYDN